VLAAVEQLTPADVPINVNMCKGGFHFFKMLEIEYVHFGSLPYVQYYLVYGAQLRWDVYVALYRDLVCAG
jgi:hypothetical protein